MDRRDHPRAARRTRHPRRALVTATLTAATLAGSVGAWWSGALPCALVVAQPACQLVVTGGPVLDAASLVAVRPVGAGSGTGSGTERDSIEVREPAGRLLVTTIEVSEPAGMAAWWSALRDPDVDLVARARLVPPGGTLGDVADAGRERMLESRTLAVVLALETLGLVASADVPAWAWPVTVDFATDEVGGPSAGLMLALGVVAQLAAEDPTLVRGALAGGGLAGEGPAQGGARPLLVAGTGALDPDGRVVGVGGLAHKLRSVTSGAGPVPDVFLLPADDLPLARRALVDRDLLLVPVADLGEAVELLGAVAAGDVPERAVLLAARDAGAR